MEYTPRAMNAITPELTESLHATYLRLVGRPVELDYLKRQMWSQWKNYCLHDPFTEKDLALVVKFLKHKILKREKKPTCLYFRNLIESPDYFQEERTDARGWARTAPSQPDRESVLRSASRPEKALLDKAVRVDVILERPKLATMLKEWREKNL